MARPGRIGVLRPRMWIEWRDDRHRNSTTWRHRPARWRGTSVAMAALGRMPGRVPMKTVLFTMITSLAIAAGGCVDGANDGAQPLPAPLVSAERGGAHVAIYQLTPGDLAVVAGGELPAALEGKTPVEVYEAIAAEPAPSVLIDSQARIAALQALHAGDHPGSIGNAAVPARSGITNLTATDFQNQWCNPGGVTFDYCWTNRTNNYSTTFNNIKWIHSHVNAYSGSLTHSLSYRGFLGSWQLIDSDTTTSSSYVSTFNEQSNGDYEVSLTNAAGDGYHLSLHGEL
jgi:hypothetical protein